MVMIRNNNSNPNPNIESDRRTLNQIGVTVKASHCRINANNGNILLLGFTRSIAVIV